MRAAAKLEHGHIRPLNHGAHPDRPHELLGFHQAIGLENDVADPERWTHVLFTGHDGYLFAIAEDYPDAKRLR